MSQLDDEDDNQSRPFRPQLRAGMRYSREAADRPILMFEGGEFVFITGPSGSGKSTLLRLLYRADRVDQGRILFLGRDIARLRDDSVPFLRRNIGVVFQD